MNAPHDPLPDLRGEPPVWGVGEVILEAVQIFKRSWLGLADAFVFYVGGLWLTHLAITFGLGGQVEGGLDVVIQVGLSSVAVAFLSVGWMRVLLAAARGWPMEAGWLLSGLERLPTMLGVIWLCVLATVPGLIPFVVPGVVVGLGLMFSGFLAADTSLGPVRCIQVSWRISRGQKWRLLQFVLAALVLNVGPSLIVGPLIAVTLPVTWLAVAVIYTRVTGTAYETGPEPVAE